MPPDNPGRLRQRLLDNVWVALDEQNCEWLLQWLAGGNTAGRRKVEQGLGVAGEDLALLKAAFASLDEYLFRDGRLVPGRAGIVGLEKEAARRRFRQLVKAFHPDRFTDLSEWLTPRSQAIHDAYAAFKRGESPVKKDRRDVAGPSRPLVRRRPPVKDEGPFWPAFIARWRSRIGHVRNLPQLILGAVGVLAALPVAVMYIAGGNGAPPAQQSEPVLPLVANLEQPADPVAAPADVDEADAPWWYNPPSRMVAVVGTEAQGERLEAQGERHEVQGERLKAQGEEREAEGEKVEDQGQRIKDKGEEREAASERLMAEVVGREEEGERLKAQGERHEAQGARLEAQGEGHEAQGERLKAQGERHEAQGERRKAQGERRKAQGEEREVQGERQVVQAEERENWEEETARMMARWLVFLAPDFRPEWMPEVDFSPTGLNLVRVLDYERPALSLEPLTRPAPEQAPEPEPEPEPEPQEPPLSESMPEVEIVRLMETYRQSIEDGNLDAFLGHFTGRPRENTNEGRDWFAHNYGRLFRKTSRRRLVLEIAHVQPAPRARPTWTVEARYRMEVTYPNNRQRSSTGQSRFTIEKDGGEWRIAVIEH